MSEVVGAKSHEEYEDDFEKDLDWLISEEGRSEDPGPEYEDIEADIDKELEEDERHQQARRKEKSHKAEKRGNKMEELEEDEERWPSPMEPLEYDSDRDSPSKSAPGVPPPPEIDDRTDEEKKYILEKIHQANQELRNQEVPDVMRHRRLHFKDTLVTLVVPPLQFEKDDGEEEARSRGKDAEMEVSGRLSELKLSPREVSLGGCGGFGRVVGNSEEGQELKEGRVLVEKDGKFDLVSLKEVESQGLLPPIENSHIPQEQAINHRKSHTSGSSPRSRDGSSPLQQGLDHLRAPRPPAQPKSRPCSASHSQNGSQRRGTKRRVHSASGTPCQATYTLSPQQKELLQRIQERKEKLAIEAEQRKREEEEQRRQENEVAFKAWLIRKREQLQEERRIHRAQEMERMNSQKEPSDPQEAFRLWLQRKEEQQQRDRRLVELRRLEEDGGGYLLRSREECERAFKLWLTRKRAEQRAEQQAARERSRRLLLEERRARRARDLRCAAGDASRLLTRTEPLTYRF